MKPEKVVLFGPYPPPYGGVATYVSTLDYYFRSIFNDYSLVTYSENGQFKTSEEPSFRDVYSNFNAIMTKQTICFDSCSFFIEYPAIKTMLAWMILKIKNNFQWIKIIHDGSLPSRYKSFGILSKLCVRLAIHMVDDIVVVNKELDTWIKDQFNAGSKIIYINSLLPIPDVEYSIDEVEILLGQSRLFDSIICSVGVFLPVYGFQDVIEAVEQIRETTGQNIGLILIDGGYAGDEDFKVQIIKNREWIIVLTRISHDHVLNILKTSQVFVRSVKFESYGLSRVEAILCGTPVIATNTGEVRGMSIYNFGDISTLTKMIGDIVSNPTATKDLSYWSTVYRQEANSNLQQLVALVK